MMTLCRDCFHLSSHATAARRCPNCHSPRLVSHGELEQLSIAHIDCDAFYASVEKRDRPELRDKPVIVGGGHRGVVAAACYVARIYGVRSAMPMFKALKACPDAIVLRPDMAKYQSVGRQIRERMQALTPLVEPLSIDEAFLDLSGTEKLHKACPAVSLARFAREIERDVGVTVSVGLGPNKFLAKIASDLDKPRGFAVIGRNDAKSFLADKPVGIIWGVGKALQRRLAADGVHVVSDLTRFGEIELIGRYGAIGGRLHRFARGVDDRRVEPDAPTKSISAETTFDEDISDPSQLRAELWPLCERVAERLRQKELAGRSVVLKLKTARFRTLTRSRLLVDPTQLAETIFIVSTTLLEAESSGTAYRLIGVGVADLTGAQEADPPSLFDARQPKLGRVEATLAQLRSRLGDKSVLKGRSLSASAKPAQKKP